jgi:hypothetical protein
MVGKCKEEICSRTPAFNYKNEKGRLYCRLHKKDDMIDIKTKRCLEAVSYTHLTLPTRP